jgi:hypothetical protein
MIMKTPTSLAAVLMLAMFFTGNGTVVGQVAFTRDFAPTEGWVKPVEQPFRQDLCLNGSWQF